MKDVLVAIPVFNEAGSIGAVVSGVKKLGLDVLVIDDGSDDSSAEIAKQKGAALIANGKNYGKGHSLKKAIEYLMANNYNSMVMMDGDGQHQTEDILNFLSKDLADYDVIVGNRMSNTKKMPFVRLTTNKFMSFLISRICRQDIKDTQCGFRLFRRNVLKRLKLASERFEIESEMLLEASKLNFKIGNASVQTIYSSEKSKINPVVDTIRFFSFLFKFLREK